MKLSRPFLLSLIILLFLPFATILPASAQTGVGPYLGAQIGQTNSFSGITARFAIGPFQFAPAVEANFLDGLTQWQLNSDFLYGFGVREAILTPYLGAGVSLRNEPESSVSPGVNVLAGVNFNFGPLVPFVQSRISVAGGTDLSVIGGLLVRPQFRRE